MPDTDDSRVTVNRMLGGVPYLIDSEINIPEDEVNPDTISSTISMATQVLEAAWEDEAPYAADWGSYRVDIMHGLPRRTYTVVRVSARRLP